MVFHSRRRRHAVEIRCPLLGWLPSTENDRHSRREQAARSYEFHGPTRDVFQQFLEERDALCSRTNPQMSSGSRLYYKSFAGTKPGPAEKDRLRREEDVSTLPISPVQSQPEPEFAALVAIDWADEKHLWSLEDTATHRRERGAILHTPEAVEAWVAALRSRFGERPIAVAVEQSRGALVFMLSKYSYLYLYPIHPTTAAQFRAALFPSGAKDDPSDADLLLDLLVHHRSHLRRLQPDTEQTRTLQMLVEERRRMVNEKTRQSNRLTDKLKLYFPQVLCWFGEIDSALAGAFLRRWPTLEALQRARPNTLQQFFYQHNCRSEERIQQRIEQSREAIPATRDQAVIRAAVAAVTVFVQLIQALREGIATLDKQIHELACAHPDFVIYDSLPGAGKVMIPRLIAAMGSRRERFASAAEIQSYSGIAPVLERSGRTHWTHSRWACPKFLRQTFHEWAGHSIPWSGWARAFYDRQRARGKTHHAAVRALAFKWIRILFRCWKDRKPYDATAYDNALRQREQRPQNDPANALPRQWKTCGAFSQPV
jgi:transposase